MRVQLLNRGEPTKQYAVIFYTGDEAFSGLLEFAKKYQVTSAQFTAIGAWMEPRSDGLLRSAKCIKNFHH